MNGYSTHWTITILVAIVLHILAALGFSYVLPFFMPKPTIANVAELELVDVELLPDVEVIAEEAIPTEAIQETLPTFNASDLVIPEFEMPEIKIEPLPEIKPVEPPKPKPVENEPPKKIETEPDKKIDAPKNDKQLMSKPPVTIKEVYPERGSGLGYKGYVSIMVTIGKDGKVKATEVVQSSGRLFVDEIALKAAEQWTFKPALDQICKPMLCNKIIIFDFKKFADA